jgi:hypothetical protein
METSKYDFFGAGRPTLQDRIDIEDVITAVTLFVDTHQFDRLAQLFMDDATMDYSTLFGPDQNAVPAKEFLANVSKFIPGFDSTQHMVTNFDIRVFGDRAETRSQVRASHRIGDRTWIAGSIYFHTLMRAAKGWKIKLMGVTFLFEEGDRGMIKEAEARLESLAT